MAKEPTSPPEDYMKPAPPSPPPPREPRLTTVSTGVLAEKNGDVVFSGAERCIEHPDCMVVTTQIASQMDSEAHRSRLHMPGTSRTNDPGYEPGSLTNEQSPDCVPVGQTVTPEWPEPGWGTAMDERDARAGAAERELLLDLPQDVIEGSDEPLDRPYAIIEDMGTLFRELCDDVLDSTAKLRSAALKWLCRAIASAVAVVIFGLLIVGGVGVVLAVWLFKAMDVLELRYWRARPSSRKTAQRMNHIRRKP